MKAANVYLNFNGECGEAMKFYAENLGAKLEMQTFKDSGMSAPGGENLILHARMTKGGAATVIMASDAQPNAPVTMGDNMWVSIDCDDNEEQDNMWNAFVNGGSKIVMKLDMTFWGARFGMLRDRYGVGWMFNCEQKK